MQRVRLARQAGVFVTAALLVILLIVPSAPAGRAAPSVAFSGIAAAAGVEIEVSSPSLPVAQSLVTSFPAAQALLDSIGQSRGYAAAPYPGDLMLSLPGLIATLGLSYVPPYPLIAQTESPTTTDDSVAQGPLQLVAGSDADASQGTATVGAGSGLAQFVASARVVRDRATGGVTVDADSRFDGLNIKDVLQLGSVASHASAVLGADGAVSLDHETTVDGLVIAGLPIGLTGDGLVLLGVKLPIPLDLNNLLAGTGLSVTYLGPQVEPDGKGIVAAGLEITQVIEGVMTTPITVRATLGRARARLVGTPVPALNLGSFAPPTTLVAAPGPTPGAAPVTRGPVAVTVPSVAASPAPAPRPVGSAPSGGLIAEVIQFKVAGFYLVLLVASAVTIGAGRLFRYVGVDEP